MKLNHDQKGVVAFVILVVLALLALMVVRAHAHDGDYDQRGKFAVLQYARTLLAARST